MTPWDHAASSARKFGGYPSDYYDLHDWFDETKAFTGDWTHRALRHHSAGIQWAIEKFGPVVVRATDGKSVPVKLLAEQHVLEDCGYIPTPADWLCVLREHPSDWMLKVGRKSTETKLEVTS